MCIIATDSSKDLRVRNTNIFVMPNTGRTRQITVYQNTVACDTRAVMILPVPNPDTFQVESCLPGGLFAQLYCSVLDLMGSHGYHAFRCVSSIESLPKFLMPGGYIASLAHSLHDIHRVDSTTFQIQKDVLDFLDTEYSGLDYPLGFLVCKLIENTSEVEYTPICYTHAMIKPSKLFIPTLHYHQTTDMSHPVDWDHSIYSVQTDIYANTPGFIPREINSVSWKAFPVEYQYDRLTKVHYLRLQGTGHPNQDLLFTVPFSRIANEWTQLAF
jgi:hypothetical protein